MTRRHVEEIEADGQVIGTSDVGPAQAAAAQAQLWQQQAESGACDVPDDAWPPIRTFDKLAPKLARLGYEPIPITLPTDRARWISAPGKQPAMCSGWQKGCPERVWERYADKGVGILARSTPGLDIDITDAELAVAIANNATGFFGPTLERIGRPPKRLLPYRLAGELFRKLKLEWPEGAVEILAAGQQYVVAGIHPDSGEPYTWTGLSREIWNVPASWLPPISQHNALRFMRALAKWLARHGSTGIAAKGFQLEPPKPKPERSRCRGASRDRYLDSALQRGSQAVRAAAEGSRNETLFREACSLGRFIQEARLTAAELEATLLAASTLPNYEAARTIVSAFRTLGLGR
jgi:hypothetical protein